MAGKHYVSATKHRTPNLGERKAEFKTDEGINHKIMIQEADIGKLLISVVKLVENGNEVNLSKRNPYIKNLKTGMVTKLVRKKGQFILRMHAKRQTSPVFSRQGS